MLKDRAGADKVRSVMADDFDPYYTWLGIPPEEQPADHYRLLGVRRFEGNADVITNAMDQRMTYLRSLQVGKRSALSQKILNEVSAASVVLLDSEKRARYDQELRAKEAKAAAATLPPAAAPPTSTAATPAKSRPLRVASALPKATADHGPRPSGSQGVAVSTAPAVRTGRHGSKPSLLKSPAVLGGIAFAVVAMLGLAGMIVMRSLQKESAEVTGKRPPVVNADKGKGKPTVAQQQGDKNKMPRVGPAVAQGNPMSMVPGSIDGWWNNADASRQLHVLALGRRDSVEIPQTGSYLTLGENATLEGWFKLQLDSPGMMTLLGTRTGAKAGAPPKGWVLFARRAVAGGTMVNQLILEFWKEGAQFVQFPAPFPNPSDWHHLALVSMDGKEGQLFVDGKKALQFPMEPGLAMSGANLRLGDDASGRGSGMVGQVCGLRLADTARYQKDFTPPSPLEMVHDQPTVASLFFKIAAPNAAVGTVRRSVPQWQYGYGQYDAGAKKVQFTPMLEWTGLQWKSGPSAPKQVAEWMSLDPLGGHTGNGQQYAVIRRWTAPADGSLKITGTLTHAHESKFGDGIHARLVSSAAGEVGNWDSRFTPVETTAEIAVKKGELLDFLVDCKENNHCDKFAWQVQLSLAGEGGKALGTWDSEQDFHGPNYSGAIYQFARLNSAAWQRLNPSQPVSLTQLAPLGGTAGSDSLPSGKVDLIAASYGKLNVGRGGVIRDGTALRTKPGAPTAFMVPASFPDAYVLEAELVRETGEDSICIGFPIPGGRRMTAIVDGQKGTKSGLASVNDQQIFTKDNPLVHEGRLLSGGEPATIRIRVDNSAVELFVNGSSIARYKINAKDDVANAKGMGYPDASALSIHTWNSPFRINRLEMTPQAGGTAPGPSPSPGGPINLVQRYARGLRLLRGQLSYSDSGGWLMEGASAGFMIPHSVPDEYVLEAEVVREEGDDSISFHLPVRGSPLSAIIDGYDSRVSGLSNINDWHLQSRDNPLVHRGAVLKNGEPAQVRIVVSQNEISLSVDGKKLSSWTYDPSATLRPYQGHGIPDPQMLGVLTWKSKYRIKRLELLAPAGGTPPASTSPPAASPVQLVDESRRNMRLLQGGFNVSGNSLTTGKGRTRLILGTELPEEYALEADITRVEGDDTLGIGFTVQGRPLCVLIDGWRSARSGICLIPGQDARMPGGPTMREGSLLTNGSTVKVRIVVNRQEVRFEIDGNAVARWQNDPQAELRAFGDYEPEDGRLSIGSWSSYRIDNLTLIPGSVRSPTPSSSSFAAAKKAPIPDEAAKTAAKTQVTAVFGEDLKGAKTLPAKSALAKNIFDLAKDTTDLTTRYVMLEEARKLFIDVKDVGAAMQTVDLVAQDFEVETLPAKAKVLQSLAEGTLSAAQRAEIVTEACNLGYEAIDSDQQQVAQELVAVARTAASRATAADVKAEAKEFMDEFAQRRKRWDAVRKAEQTLAEKPGDPAANLVLGLYHTFDRSDLAKGLPLLAAGSDPKLAAAAKARQESMAKGLTSSLAEADAWFASIGTTPPDYKVFVQRRALDAYDLAVPSAAGIEKANATKRRDQLKADLASAAASGASTRGSRLRKSDLPERSRGMVGRVYLGGKDAGLFVTFDPQRRMDVAKLREILTKASLRGGGIKLVGVLRTPAPLALSIDHRGSSTGPSQQLYINGKLLNTVGGNRSSRFEQIQLPPGEHLFQWNVEFDGSIGPGLFLWEQDGNRRIQLEFTRDQHYEARRLQTASEINLSE